MCTLLALCYVLFLREQVFKDREKGWAVRAAEFIPRGAFVALYAGELITGEQNRLRILEYTETNAGTDLIAAPNDCSSTD